jgi:hypothetical protein
MADDPIALCLAASHTAALEEVGAIPAGGAGVRGCAAGQAGLGAGLAGVLGLEGGLGAFRGAG